jgi:hypothetical protein
MVRETSGAMSPPMADEPADIGHEEARQELSGRPGGGAGFAVFDIVAVTLAIAGTAIAVETIDHWSQWVVLAAIIATVVGFMIAVSPNRRA